MEQPNCYKKNIDNRNSKNNMNRNKKKHSTQKYPAITTGKKCYIVKIQLKLQTFQNSHENSKKSIHAGNQHTTLTKTQTKKIK